MSLLIYVDKILLREWSSKGVSLVCDSVSEPTSLALSYGPVWHKTLHFSISLANRLQTILLKQKPVCRIESNDGENIVVYLHDNIYLELGLK